MKKSYKYIAVITVSVMMSACSENYLETSPQSSVSQATILGSTENAAMAINGICLLMTQQYGTSLTSESGTQGMNGEGTLKTWYNEYPGVDYQKTNLTGWSNVINGNYNVNTTSAYDRYPWHYLYKQISNCNLIISQIDDATGEEAERQFIKAQALTFRAYFYSTLVKYYSKRWSDAQGESRGVVLRLEPTSNEMPASTLKEVYAQVYQDLDDAIALYEASGKDRPSGDLWSPNVDVAHAVYSRAALNREDWATAYTHSKLACQNYSLMGIDEYKSGFNAPNKEWIWEAYNDESQTIYHYGFFSYNSSNTSTSAGYKYIPAISKELIDQIPEDDARRWCFLVPLDEEAGSWSTSDSGTATAKTGNGALYARAKADYGSYLYSSAVICAYMSFKFRAVTTPSVGELNLFRMAEMLYNEAEAAYHLGNYTEAQSLIEQATQPYNSSYTCTKTGSELLEEIKLYRRFDLWGEGFNWYDFKRWGGDHIRKSWSEGGSFHTTFCGTGSTGGCYDATGKNNWTWAFPSNETDYNSLVTAFEE